MTQEYPTATAVGEETQGGLVQATTVTTEAPRTAEEIRATVWGEQVDEGRDNPNNTTNNGWGQGAFGGSQATNEACQGFVSMLFFAVCIGVPIAATAGAFDGPTAAPTLAPTPAPVLETVCPVNFDGNNQSVVLTGCTDDVCGGRIEWCALPSGSYRLLIGLRGDLNSALEEVDFTFRGSDFSLNTGIQCGSNFVDVFDSTPFVHSSGTLELDYQSSAEVDNICFGDFAVEVNATLIRL